MFYKNDLEIDPGQARLNVPLEGATNDLHKLIENASGNPDSYERRATLKFIDGSAYQKIGGVWSDVTEKVISGLWNFNCIDPE